MPHAFLFVLLVYTAFRLLSYFSIPLLSPQKTSLMTQDEIHEQLTNLKEEAKKLGLHFFVVIGDAHTCSAEVSGITKDLAGSIVHVLNKEENLRQGVLLEFLSEPIKSSSK